MKMGIIGAGWIADMMGKTLQPHEDMRYAIAARDLGRAQEFAKKYGFKKAYGSYEELVKDPEVELVYIATPHSHHYAHTKLALEHGKAVLCEKAFTANAREARELIEMAEKKGLFLTEAIWTRYMPLSIKVRELCESGIIGRPRLLTASLCYPMEHKERIQRPELCGGSLLDLGVYSINFARMYFGEDIVKSTSMFATTDTGIDIQGSMSFLYRDGRIANIQSSACSASANLGIINGDKGYIVVDNINNPHVATVYNVDHEVVEVHETPKQITGYEFQVYACEEALKNGWLESPYMPHEETIKVMEVMDELRAQWGVVYPNDNV